MRTPTIVAILLGCLGSLLLLFLLAGIAFYLMEGEISSDRGDDFVNSGPYVEPTFEEEGKVFRCTREYARGKGKYPIEFTIRVPEGWSILETENSPTRNLVQFVRTNEDGGELQCLAVGHVNHTDSYDPGVDMSGLLLGSLMPMLTSQFVSQFETGGLTVQEGESGMTTVMGRSAHRTDLELSGWINDRSPPGRYFVTLVAMLRADHKPHGVLIILMSREEEGLHSCDDLFTSGALGTSFRSFTFVN